MTRVRKRRDAWRGQWSSLWHARLLWYPVVARLLFSIERCWRRPTVALLRSSIVSLFGLLLRSIMRPLRSSVEILLLLLKRWLLPKSALTRRRTRRSTSSHLIHRKAVRLYVVLSRRFRGGTAPRPRCRARSHRQHVLRAWRTVVAIMRGHLLPLLSLVFYVTIDQRAPRASAIARLTWTWQRPRCLLGIELLRPCSRRRPRSLDRLLGIAAFWWARAR